MNATTSKLYRKYCKENGILAPNGSKTIFRRIKRAHTRSSASQRAKATEAMRRELAA